MHVKLSKTATYKKIVILAIFTSLLTYFLKSKTPSVIPFWRAFLMPMKGARSKVPLSGHFKWLSQCQDWFTKSGCHLRILKLETWNFAWDLILPIHMLYKKRGSIWELFEKVAQPNLQLIFTWTWSHPHKEWQHNRNYENWAGLGVATIFGFEVLLSHASGKEEEKC